MDHDWTRAAGIAMTVLRRHDGVAPMREFRAAGLAPLQVAALLRQGAIQRPRVGWYVDPALPWQAKRAVRVGGVLSCVSAVDAFGLPVPAEARRRLHVLVPHNAPRLRHNRDRTHHVVPGEDAEVEVHWSGRAGRRTGWRTPLVEALVQLADCVPLDWWIAALDAARHRPQDGEPVLSEEDWQALREAVPERLRAALEDVDPLSESCIETLLRLAMARRGIGPVVLQFVPHPAYRADFLVGRRLLVEVDGQTYHDAASDQIRDAALRRLGYRVIRFTFDEVVHHLDLVLARIEAELAAC